MTMMSSNYVTEHPVANFLSWTDWMMKYRYGGIFRTDHIKELIHDTDYNGLYIQYGVDNMAWKQIWRPFHQYTHANEIWHKQFASTLNMQIRLKNVLSNTTPRTANYSFDIKIDESVAGRVVITAKRNSDGSRTMEFSARQAKDDKTTGSNVLDPPFPLGNSVGANVYTIDPAANEVFCKIAISIIPLSINTKQTMVSKIFDQTDADTIYQSEFIFFPDVFCTSEHEYPSGGYNEINNPAHDPKTYRISGPI